MRPRVAACRLPEVEGRTGRGISPPRHHREGPEEQKEEETGRRAATKSRSMGTRPKTA